MAITAHYFPLGKCRRVRLGTVTDARDPQGSDRAPSEDLPRRHAGTPEASEAVRGAAELHP